MAQYAAPGIYVGVQKSYPAPMTLRVAGEAGFVGLAERGPLHTPVWVASWDEYLEQFGGLIPDACMPWGVRGFFENGGRGCHVVRVAHAAAQGRGGAQKASLALKDIEQQPILRCEAVNEGTWGNNIRVSVVPLNEPKAHFHLFVKYHRQQEQFLGLCLNPSQDHDACRQVNGKSRWIRLTTVETLVTSRELPPLENQCLENGRDGLAGLEPADFLGVPGGTAPETGLQCFQRMEEVRILAIPDAVNPWAFPAGNAQAAAMVQKSLLSFCEQNGKRFALLDVPWGLDAQGAAQWRAGFDSECGALYFPWIRVLQENGDAGHALPPSGHLAGIMARLDQETRLLKHPANELVQGALGTLRETNLAVQEYLNPRGVNVLCPLKSRGTRVWGARTLSSRLEWRYINTRRLVTSVEQTLREDLSWVVFESHDESLWSSVSRDVACFLRGLWKQGYLAGTSADEAFYVKCDEELNPESERDAGRLTVEVGLAVAKPAEFIVVRLVQKNSSAE